KVGCEVCMKLRGVEVSEAVWRRLYRIGLAKITRKALSVVSLTLSSIWHVGRDVDQSDNRGMCPRFSNNGSPITMSDKNARPNLLIKDALRSDDVFFKGCLWLLDNADVVAILDKHIVDAFPT